MGVESAIEITGIVTGIRDLEVYPYDETVHMDDTFTGTYTYDSETVDSSSAIDSGRYVYNSPYGFDISLGGFEFKTAEVHVEQFRISIYDNYSLQPYDGYRVDSDQNAPLSTGLNVNRISWSLYDETHTALSSIILPSVAPSINAWGGNTFSISCGGTPNGNATFAVWGTVTEAVIVPEPATLLLVGVGGLLLRRTRGGY